MLECSGWWPECCNAMNLLGCFFGCQGVAMHLLGCSGGCLGVARHFLGCSVWLPGCYYIVARMLWMVARVLPCIFWDARMYLSSCQDSLGGFQGVAMQLLGCSVRLTVCCNAFAKMLYVVARVLL